MATQIQRDSSIRAFFLLRRVVKKSQLTEVKVLIRLDCI